MKIEAYWNTRAEAFSVRENAFGRGKRVVGHARRLLIRDATFKGTIIRGELSAVMWDDTFVFGHRYLDNWTRGDGAYASVARKRLGTDVIQRDQGFIDRPALVPRTEAPMAYLWRFDHSPAILAFDPLQMTEAESKAATV